MDAVRVPMTPLSKEMELRHQLGDSQPKAALCFDALLPILQPVCRNLEIEHVIATSYSELLPDRPTLPLPDLFNAPKAELKEGDIDFFPASNKASDLHLDDAPGMDDPAALNYTGGTTGLPKGCVHSHRNILYTVAAFIPVVYGQDVGPVATIR